MSELKAFTFCLGQYTENGSPCVVAVDDEENPRLASDEKFYLKSEADKVIAEKDKEIAELKEEIAELNRRRRLRDASKELPIDNDDVCVILENGFKTTDRYDHDKGHWHYHWSTVKYWMPLPSAPKEA